MAITIQNHYASFISRSGSSCTYYFYAEWSGNNDGANINHRSFTSPYFSWDWTPNTTATSGWWYTTLSGNPTGIPVDVDMAWYPSLHTQEPANYFGSTIVTRTVSIPATASAPSVGSITANSASVSCDFVPNVTVSLCTAQLQYKRTIDSTWINFGSPKTDGTGYGTETISGIALTGLLPSTSYDVRVSITRTTVDNTSVDGAASSFNTLPGAPTITTDAASSVAATTAQLNATLTINSGTNVTVYWKWGTDNPPTQNTTASQAASADGSYGVGISGLSGGTTYFAEAFTAFDTPAGSPANGSVLSFDTPADPAVEAVSEDHMHIYEYDGQYGVAKTVYFTLQSPAATSSDRLVTTAPGTLFAAGDIKVSKDGGGFANVANAVSQIAASNPLYSLVLSTAEMQAEDLVVQIVDQNGPTFRDAYIHIRTKLKLGQIDVDASQLSNVSAMKLTGQGTGHGLEAIGGATGHDIEAIIAKHFQRVSTCQTNATATQAILDTSANGTNDYYAGSIIMIVSGTGAGQARVITAYDGTTKAATVDTAFTTIPTAGSVALILGGDRVWGLSPSAELSVVPGSTANYGLKLQFLFQRFAFKIIQTATLQTWYKANSSTALATRAVDDDGTTQTLAKLT
jgi:hypothetical protein